MYARVVRWDGGSADAIRSTTQEIQSQSSSGPPEGVPGKAFMLLSDPEHGHVMAVTLFETEEDMRKGHEAMEAMSPPGEGMGQRTAVEMYDVAIDMRV